MYNNRFYRFSEFGREIVYDKKGANAFFLSDIEAHHLDRLQNEKSPDNNVKPLSTGDITKVVDHIKQEDLLIEPHISRQEPSGNYTLDLNVVQQCNLRCKYCYVKTPGSSFPMDKKTAQKAVDFITEFKDMKGVTISFYGGEPLLNFPVIKSTIEYAASKAETLQFPVTYHLTTNGTLLTDDIITFFSQHKITIEISIDGPAPIHNALRVTPQGDGTHTLVIHRVQKLITTPGIHTVSASSVITNRSRLKDVYHYLSQFPFQNINISCVRPLYNRKESEYRLTEPQKAQYLEDMRDLAQECVTLIMKGVHPPYYLFEKKILDLWKHTAQSRFCPAGVTRFGVSPQGFVYPCGYAADRQIWNLGTVNKLDTDRIDAWLSHASSEPEPCTQCWAHHLCGEKCPLQLADEPRCTISRHSTRLAIAVYATVKEQNEIMLAALIDPEFLSKITKLIKKMKNP